MTVEQVKQSVLETLDGVDKDKLNLNELALYAQILKTVSEIQGKDYLERLTETMANGFAFGGKPPVVSELK